MLKMSAAVILALAQLAAAAPTPPATYRPGVPLSQAERDQLQTKPAHVGSEFDCEMRAYAYEYAQTLQSWRGAEKMQEVFDSLELMTLCSKTFDAGLFAPTPAAHVHQLPEGLMTAFVDSTHSAADQTAPVAPVLGDPRAPFRTVHAAVAAVRAAGRADGERALVVLRGGTHYVTSTLELGPEDSDISILNMPGEAAAISGAKPLKTTWAVSSKALSFCRVFTRTYPKTAPFLAVCLSFSPSPRTAATANSRQPAASTSPMSARRWTAARCRACGSTASGRRGRATPTATRSSRSSRTGGCRTRPSGRHRSRQSRKWTLSR
eukprot:SAG22_NODE_1596_length_4037_cov_2.253682_5_plen_321_part_00